MSQININFEQRMSQYTRCTAQSYARIASIQSHRVHPRHRRERLRAGVTRVPEQRINASHASNTIDRSVSGILMWKLGSLRACNASSKSTGAVQLVSHEVQLILRDGTTLQRIVREQRLSIWKEARASGLFMHVQKAAMVREIINIEIVLHRAQSHEQPNA